MTDREVMRQALLALEGWDNYGKWAWPDTALEQSKRNTTESLASLRAALEQQAEPVTCAWSFEDDDTGTYSSACGELWSFIDGGWQDNHVRFCHGCGGKVVEAKLKETP